MWGESWEIKEKIGEKKISGGQKSPQKSFSTFFFAFPPKVPPQNFWPPEIFFWGGTFGGNAKKKGENFFGGSVGTPP